MQLGVVAHTLAAAVGLVVFRPDNPGIAGTIGIQNLDNVGFNNRLVFNRIQKPEEGTTPIRDGSGNTKRLLYRSLENEFEAQLQVEAETFADCAEIILGGGTGSRVGLSIPKQLIKVSGSTILEHTLRVFQETPEIDEIVLTSPEAYLEDARRLSAGMSKVTHVIPGGATRNDTSRAALDVMGDEECKVLYHDAVRPFVDRRIIVDCIEALDRYEIDLVVRNRVFGFLFGYSGWFTCDFVQATDAPDGLKPKRHERRY